MGLMCVTFSKDKLSRANFPRIFLNNHSVRHLKKHQLLKDSTLHQGLSMKEKGKDPILKSVLHWCYKIFYSGKVWKLREKSLSRSTSLINLQAMKEFACSFTIAALLFCKVNFHGYSWRNWYLGTMRLTQE